MKRKVKGKNKAAASKLKPKRILKRKPSSKKVIFAQKPAAKAHKKTVLSRQKLKSTTGENPSTHKKVVRIMGHGQFTVDNKTLQKLNKIDNDLVELVSRERSDDGEFKKRLIELNDMVLKNGKSLDQHEIIRSDIILPSADLSIDEAKKLFVGEGVIPEL